MKLEAAKRPTAIAVSTVAATQGVRHEGWTLPSTDGIVLSSAITRTVRVLWIRAVSSVATLESMTTATIIFPPAAGQTSWARTDRISAVLSEIVLLGMIIWMTIV